MMVSSAQGGAPANPSSSRPRLHSKSFSSLGGCVEIVAILAIRAKIAKTIKSA